jgi:hypothetical protein
VAGGWSQSLCLSISTTNNNPLKPMLCFIYMSLAASLANVPFGLIFAIQLTIGRPGQGRAGTGAAYQGNSGSGSMRPLSQWDCLSERAEAKAAFCRLFHTNPEYRLI